MQELKKYNPLILSFFSTKDLFLNTYEFLALFFLLMLDITVINVWFKSKYFDKIC